MQQTVNLTIIARISARSNQYNNYNRVKNRRNEHDDVKNFDDTIYFILERITCNFATQKMFVNSNNHKAVDPTKTYTMIMHYLDRDQLPPSANLPTLFTFTCSFCNDNYKTN